MFTQVRFFEIISQMSMPLTPMEILSGFAPCARRVERRGLRTRTSLHLTGYYRSPTPHYRSDHGLVSHYYRPIKTSTKRTRFLLYLLVFPSRQTQCSCTSSYPIKPSCHRLIANQVMAHPLACCQHTNKRGLMYVSLDGLIYTCTPVTSRLLNVDPRWPRCLTLSRLTTSQLR